MRRDRLSLLKTKKMPTVLSVRSPLLRWNDLVSWNRVADSLLFTGFSVPLLDFLVKTTLLDRGEVRDIAFVADNPGKWLLHCHMLSHAASGMMTWVNVA
jgi:hypothetical protein